MRAAGVSDDALVDAIHVCALFSMIVRLADSLGWDVPSFESFAERADGDAGERLHARGLKQRDGLRGEALAATGEAEPVGRRRANRDAVRVDLERPVSTSCICSRTGAIFGSWPISTTSALTSS